MVLPGGRSKSNRSKAEMSLKWPGVRKNSTGAPDSGASESSLQVKPAAMVLNWLTWTLSIVNAAPNVRR